MLNNFKKSAALLATTAAFTLTVGAVDAASLEEIKNRGTIRIAIANEIPYGYMDMSGEARGPGPEVAKHVVEAMGIDNIQWEVTNFSSLIPGLRADRFDIVAAEMAVLPERCESVIYSVPNSTYGEGLLVPAGNPKDIHAYSDFAEGDDLKVAIMAGADQLMMLQALGVPQSNMVTISSNADAISTVSTGRADAYAATGMTVSELASKSDEVQIVEEFVDPVIDGEEVRSWGAFAFSSDSEALRDAFNQHLIEFKQTEEWREILSSYGFSQTDIEASFERTTEELCSAE